MVPLCIKAYEGKRPLSKEITQAAPDYGYQLEGPMGRGLEIPPGFTGEVVIIAAGTGILPFADILDLLLKKTIFSLLKARNQDTSIILPQQDYDAIFAGMSFKLLAAFRTFDDFVNYKTVAALNSLSQDHKIGNFQCATKVSGQVPDKYSLPQVKSHFTTEFLSQYVTQSTGLLLLCGPPEMLASLHTSLHKDLKIPNHKIVFV